MLLSYNSLDIILKLIKCLSWPISGVWHNIWGPCAVAHFALPKFVNIVKEFYLLKSLCFCYLFGFSIHKFVLLTLSWAGLPPLTWKLSFCNRQKWLGTSSFCPTLVRTPPRLTNVPIVGWGRDSSGHTRASVGPNICWTVTGSRRRLPPGAVPAFPCLDVYSATPGTYDMTWKLLWMGHMKIHSESPHN